MRFYFVLLDAPDNAINLKMRAVPPFRTRGLTLQERKEALPGRVGIYRFSEDAAVLELYYVSDALPRPKAIDAKPDLGTFVHFVREDKILNEKHSLDGRWWLVQTTKGRRDRGLVRVGTLAEIRGQVMEILEPAPEVDSWGLNWQYFLGVFPERPSFINLLPFPTTSAGNPYLDVRHLEETTGYRGIYSFSDDNETVEIYLPASVDDPRPNSIPKTVRGRSGEYFRLMKGAKQLIESGELDGVWQIVELTVGQNQPANSPNEALIFGQCIEIRYRVTDNGHSVSHQYYAAYFEGEPRSINLVRFPVAANKGNPFSDVHQLNTTMGLKGIYRLSDDGRTAEIYHTDKPEDDRPDEIPNAPNDRTGIYFRLIKQGEMKPPE